MLATPGRSPSPMRGGPIEIKWDGVRAITFVEGGRIRMQSRNDKELAPSFPEFREIGLVLGSRPVRARRRDRGHRGEWSTGFRPLAASPSSRERQCQSRSRARPRRPVMSSSTCFISTADRCSLCPTTTGDSELEELGLSGASFTTADSFRDVKGADILRATKEAGLEGRDCQAAQLALRRRASGATRGSRSRTSGPKKSSSAAGPRVQGVGPGASAPFSWGSPPPRVCASSERSGPGSATMTAAALMELLRPAARTKNPFTPASDMKERDPHFVKADLVGEVRFGEWTRAGRLRHPVWRGLRPDKEAKDVEVES